MSPRKRHILRRLAGLGMLLCLSAALPIPTRAQTSPYTPYQLKALYLHNFAKYTEWPKEVLGDESAPFVLGILGKDPFGKAIEIIEGKPIKGRKLSVKHFSNVQEVKDCHLLFICSSELDRLPHILKALEKSSILTIAEVEGFLQYSGMINLVAEQKSAGSQSVAFEINRAAAEKVNLKLDTQLLKLAKRVKS
jgi:hypothetical protein